MPSRHPTLLENSSSHARDFPSDCKLLGKFIQNIGDLMHPTSLLFRVLITLTAHVVLTRTLKPHLLSLAMEPSFLELSENVKLLTMILWIHGTLGGLPIIPSPHSQLLLLSPKGRSFYLLQAWLGHSLHRPKDTHTFCDRSLRPKFKFCVPNLLQLHNRCRG